MTPHGADEDHEQRSEREDDQQPGQHVRQRRQLRDVADLATGVRLQHDRAELVEQRSPRRVAVDARPVRHDELHDGRRQPEPPQRADGQRATVGEPRRLVTGGRLERDADDGHRDRVVPDRDGGLVADPLADPTEDVATEHDLVVVARRSALDHRRVHRTPVRFDGDEADRQAIDRRARDRREAGERSDVAVAGQRLHHGLVERGTGRVAGQRHAVGVADDHIPVPPLLAGRVDQVAQAGAHGDRGHDARHGKGHPDDRRPGTDAPPALEGHRHPGGGHGPQRAPTQAGDGRGTHERPAGSVTVRPAGPPGRQHGPPEHHDDDPGEARGEDGDVDRDARVDLGSAGDPERGQR